MSSPGVGCPPGPVQVVVASFGYLHLGRECFPADVVVDVREHLRDPYIDPALRELTGRDAAVIARVLATPGATGLIEALVATAAALLPGANRAGRLVRLAIGCAGGRHRSVVLANTVTTHLTRAGWSAHTEHHHLDRPVVQRERGTQR